MSIRIINQKDFEENPHPSDYESAKNTPIKESVTDSDANNIAFSIKPWGSECLRFRNRHFDIWELTIHPHSATSSHIHTKKDSLLIIIEGDVILATTNKKNYLAIGDFRLSKRGAIHRIINDSQETVRILEIESPPDRDDLIRIEDKYGREGLPYISHHPQPTNKDLNHYPQKFFQRAQEQNDSFELFDLVHSPKKQESLNMFGIACRKEISLKNTDGLHFLQKHPAINHLRSFFVLQGSISIKDSTSPIKIAKRGECITISNSSEIIRLPKGALVIGWK